MTKSRFLLLTMASLLIAASVLARDREFHDIVDRVAGAYHKKPMPMMGLVSFAARSFMPAGVGGLKMAVFVGVNPALLNGHDLDGFMQRVAGADYHPFVQVRSGHDSEQTCIYLHELKDASELLIVNLDAGSTVVVQVRLKPEAMKDWMDDPVGEGKAHRNGEWRAGSDD